MEQRSFRRELASLVGARGVSARKTDLLACVAGPERYALGFRVPPQQWPQWVVWPRVPEHVSALVALCRREGVAIRPLGGGSAGVVWPEGGVALDMRGLQQVLHIDEISRVVRVQAGATGGRVDRALQEQGLALCHRPISMDFSTVGGWIASDGVGITATRHGSVGHQCLGLSVVLPDGEVWHSVVTPRAATGPDLVRAFVGTKGRLAIILAVTLRTMPLPRRLDFRAFSFPSLGQALAACRALIRADILPLATCLSQGDPQGPGEGRPLLMMVLAGGSERRLWELASMAEGALLKEAAQAEAPGLARAWWNRPAAEMLSLRNMAGEGMPIIAGLRMRTLWSQADELLAAVRDSLATGERMILRGYHFGHHDLTLEVSLMGPSGTEPGPWSQGVLDRVAQGISSMDQVFLPPLLQRGPLTPEGRIWQDLRARLDPQAILAGGQGAAGVV